MEGSGRPSVGALALAALLAWGGGAFGLSVPHLPARPRCAAPRMDFEFTDQPAVAHAAPAAASGRQLDSEIAAPKVPLRQVFSSAELQSSLTTQTGAGALTVVFFGSKSCASCRAVLSRLRQLDHTLEHVRFLHLNLADETREAFLVHEITHMPMAYVYDAHGAFLESHLCLRSGLRDFLNRLYKLLSQHGSKHGVQHGFDAEHGGLEQSSQQPRISYG